MKDFQAQVNQLLENAMKQPGVAEIVEIYNSQQPAIDAHQFAQQAISPKWIASSTTSSLHNTPYKSAK